LLVVVAGSAASGQSELQIFFKERIQLNGGQIRDISNGKVVTKVLDAHDKYGVLTFGAVHINATIAEYASVYRDVDKLQGQMVYLIVQEFGKDGAPVKLSDFDRFVVEKKDVDEIEKCRPGNCEIQLGDMASFQNLIDWKSNDRYAQVNEVARHELLEGMNRYIAGGLKALGSYRDRKNPLSLYDAMKTMIDRAGFLQREDAPQLYQYIVEYPQDKLEGAEDFFYWEKIDFGQEITNRVNHVTMAPISSSSSVKFVVANKQLYASRYIRVALQLYACVPDSPDQSKPGFFLVEINSSLLPDFNPVKLGIARKIATGKAVESTEQALGFILKNLTNK
jgi:hypothetical protein